MADPFLHTIPAWRWALTQTRRDLRATSMRVLLVAVTLAVAALTAVALPHPTFAAGHCAECCQTGVYPATRHGRCFQNAS